MARDSEELTIESIERRSTGISGLDYQLGGGVPAGTSIVVYGNPLAGSDRLAKQFWHANDTVATYLMLDSKMDDGMVDAKDAKIHDLASLMTSDRIIIDSLSTLIVRDGIDATIEFMTTGIQEVLEKRGNILFILYEGLHTPIEQIRVERVADIFISMREEYHQNEIERKLIVHKIPYMDVPSRIYPFIIRDNGIELSTTARVV
jgi:KaiC/GvpD/RAD55 family RecA-like ATPase